MMTDEEARAQRYQVGLTMWLPMETAPKDGSEFLAFGDVADYRPKGIINVMRWRRDQSHPEGGHFISRCTVWPELYSSALLRPTHWRAIPPPPSVKGDK